MNTLCHRLLTLFSVCSVYASVIITSKYADDVCLVYIKSLLYIQYFFGIFYSSAGVVVILVTVVFKSYFNNTISELSSRLMCNFI